MILDDKVIMRPPSYQSSPSIPINLSTLPPHILLLILHRTFPQTSKIPDQDIPELQRKTLYWLSISLRLVNHALYTASMHILRSTYLRAYQALLKPPYTSDPFPTSLEPPSYDTDTEESPLQTIQRETLVLDRFITLKVREDVFTDESSLHIEGEDKFRDLFNLAQPQARLEDLIRVSGLSEGVVSIPGPTPTYTSSSSQSINHSNAFIAIPRPPVERPSNGFFSSLRKLTLASPPSPPPSPRSKFSPTSPKPIQPIPFSSLSITFTFQTARLIQKRKDGTRRCLAEIPRSRGGMKESLEVLAEGLVRALKEDLQ